MAVSASTVWNARTDGNSANGGGFVTGASGTDRSLQAAPHVTIDGATISFELTSATVGVLTGYTVVAGDVGNIVNINGGTMTAGRYEITVVDTGANTWTIDRSGGIAGQTGTGRMGGAVDGPDTLTAIDVATNVGADGQSHRMKSGTYLVTSSTPLNFVHEIDFEGYNSVYDDIDPNVDPTTNCPIIRANHADVTQIVTAASGGQGDRCYIKNLVIDGNSQTTTTGYQDASLGTRLKNVKISGCTTNQANMNSAGSAYWSRVEITGGSVVGILLGGGDLIMEDCYIHDIAAHGLTWTNGRLSTLRCIWDTITGGNDCIRNTNAGHGIFKCEQNTFYNCTGAGIIFTSVSSTTPITVNNCVFDTVTTGISTSSTSNNALSVANSFYSGTTDHNNVRWIEDNDTLDASPFVNAGSGDFNPQVTIQSGKDIVASGKPNLTAGNLTDANPGRGAGQNDTDNRGNAGAPVQVGGFGAGGGGGGTIIGA